MRRIPQSARLFQTKEARLMKGVVDNATRPSGEFIFELWADGHPADPEKYVIFQ